MQITRQQFKAARALLDMKQADLAQLAGVALMTMSGAERHGAVTHKTKAKIAKALRSKGIKFRKNGVWKSL